MGARAETCRLFFALWPDQHVRAVLAAIASLCGTECGGRAVPAPNIHLTLAFLGEVDSERVCEVSALAEAIRSRPFEWVLDTRGYWRRNRIVWMGGSETPPALRDLARELMEALRAHGVRYDTRDYVPHITLVRDARRPPRSPPPAPIVWPVSEFVLVRSTTGRQSSVYEILARWPLQPVLQARY